VLSGVDVRLGSVKPDEMTIIRDDKQVLIATKITPSASVIVIRLDRETGNAMWGKVGDVLGVAIGWVQYLECR
jgi:hypothetical protein